MDRQAAVLEGLSVARRASAVREQVRFDAFCTERDLVSSREAIILYLTHHMIRGGHAANLRYRLGLLDVMARARGRPPWSTDPELRLFVRGLFTVAPPPSKAAADPVYVETVQALIDAIDIPTYPQIRQAALICLAHYSRLRACELHTLQWQDVRIRATEIRLRLQPHRGTQTLEVTVPVTGGATCPAAALLRLHSRQGRAVGPVFDRAFTSISRTLAPLGYTDGWTRRPPLSEQRLLSEYERIMQPTARQVRDAAIVLLSCAANLATGEVMALHRSDVRTTSRGLLLDVAGRRNPVGVARTPDPTYCPVSAWERWDGVRAQTTTGQAHAAAFLQIEGEHRIIRRTMTRPALNGMVHRAATAAGLNDAIDFGSLRLGAIRTATRSGTPVHVIAARAGLRALDSVERHRKREELLTNNVATRLGL